MDGWPGYWYEFFFAVHRATTNAYTHGVAATFLSVRPSLRLSKACFVIK